MTETLAWLTAYGPSLAAGTALTLALTLAGGLLSLVLGVALALPRAGLTGRLIGAAEEVVMGLPLLLLLVFLYFGLGQIGVDLPPWLAGAFGLGLHAAPYNAAAIRAGFAAVPQGQREAAAALGLRPSWTLRLVLLPQAIRAMALPLGGNLIAMLKDSALVSVIGAPELVQAAQRGIAETFQPFGFYLAVAAIYYGLSLLLQSGLSRLTRGGSAGAHPVRGSLAS